MPLTSRDYSVTMSFCVTALPRNAELCGPTVSARLRSGADAPVAPGAVAPSLSPLELPGAVEDAGEDAFRQPL